MMLCGLILLLCTGTSVGTKGRDFVAAFFEHFTSNFFPEIFFIILADVNTTVHIESVGFQISEDIFVEGMVEYKYTTNASYFYQGNLDVTDMTFHITSIEDITLFGYNYLANRGDGYVAIPVQSLSTRYMIVTHNDDDTSDYGLSLTYTGTTHTVFIVIATEDDTNVDVSLKVKGINKEGGCANGMLKNGDVRPYVLHKYQIIGTYCDDDITGTEINSDKPVAVLSGHNHKKFSDGIPDHLIEMLLPVQSFGRSFFLPETPVQGALYRVVGSEDATKIRSPSGLEASIVKGEPYDLEVNSTTGPMYIEADNPVIVVQFTTQRASMAVVPPVSLYSSIYDVARPILHGGQYEIKSMSLTVVVPVDKVLGLQPDIFSQFEVVKGTCFAFATVDLNEGFHRLSHIDNIQFGAMLYFTSSFKGFFSHPAGYNMTDYIGKTSCPTSEVCSDGTPYPCTCTAGYFRYQCHETSSGCSSTSCQYNSSCVEYINTYQCSCVNGSGGAHCEIDTYDNCKGNSCINGICDDKFDQYTCNCTKGFEGVFCEEDIDECASKPCVHGTCQDNVNNYTCSCNPGYVGRNCDTDADPCISSPCQNNGTCIQATDGFNCSCPPGTDGYSCEIDIDECASKPCVHGACQDNVNNYTCSCNPGYVGRNCDTDADPCSSSPCQNNGTCIQTTDGFNCSCPPGTDGYSCEIDPDLCSSEPCQNNGLCAQTPDGFECSCPAGTEGTYCEIDTNECASSPCQNNGTCIDHTNAFECLCLDNYNGVFCEFLLNCGCGCFNFNMTDDELAARIQWWRSLLLLDRSKLSKEIRKKISIPDDRPLSTGIGLSGVTFLVLSLGLIVLFDMMTIRRSLMYEPKQSKTDEAGQVPSDDKHGMI